MNIVRKNKKKTMVFPPRVNVEKKFNNILTKFFNKKEITLI